MALDTLNDTSDASRIEDGRLSTGIAVLDNEYLHGIPKGSVVAILADSYGMADLFMYHLVHTDRPTNYISTVRPGRLIRNTLSDMGSLSDDLDIQDIHTTNDETDAILRKYSDRLKEDHNFIVDSMSAYDADSPELYLQTLRHIYTNVADNDALAYLYFSTTDISALSPVEREALHMCDAIFSVKTAVSGDSIDSHLEVLKMRGCELPDSIIKLNLGRLLTVDTTRDIA